MRFNVLTNPFAVLDLTGDADAGTISGRARDLATPEAMAASRSLLVPRIRLEAELRYLPGASAEVARECIRSLRDGRRPDLWPLSPLARANIVAHLAAGQSATGSDLRDLAGLQETILETAEPAINAARERARLAPVSPEMLGETLEKVVEQHAEVFSTSLLALIDGADLFAELIQLAGREPSARASFLRQASIAWDRAISSEVAGYLEEAQVAEASLAAGRGEVQARKLAEQIKRFAKRTKPRREACRTIGLPHEASEEAARRWRGVALDLNNRQDSVQEAVTVLEALVDGFGTTDELGAKTARDLEVCRGRLTSGVGSPEWRRLIAAVSAATEASAAFKSCRMLDGRPTAATPAVVRELHDAFVATTRPAKSELPWQILREFSLRLHNEWSATEAALALTKLAISQIPNSGIQVELLPRLEEDARTLRVQLLQAELSAAVSAKDHEAMRRILSDLIPLTEDRKQKSEYQSALDTLNQRRLTGRFKGAFYAALAVLAIWYFATVGSTPRQTSHTPSYTAPNTSFNASGGTAHSAPVAQQPSDPDAGKPFLQPQPGPTVLTRAELRWCDHQFARIDVANEYLEQVRGRSNFLVANFNAAVAEFNRLAGEVNASCRNRQYWVSDKTVVGAEVVQRANELKADTQNYFARIVYPTPPVSTPAPAYTGSPSFSAPAQSATPQPTRPESGTKAPAFEQGLADREAWERWLAGQGGAYRAAAEWWASVRSEVPRRSCQNAPGTDRGMAVAGCNAAYARLSTPDARRVSEPDYRAGWNSFVEPPSQPRAFAEGLADRQAWEAWFSSLTGAFHDGAEWWSSVRSKNQASSCNDVPGTDHTNAVAGCNAARARLMNPDRRRRSEPDYRAGWNSL